MIEKPGIHFKTDVFATVAAVDAKAPYWHVSWDSKLKACIQYWKEPPQPYENLVSRLAEQSSLWIEQIYWTERPRVKELSG